MRGTFDKNDCRRKGKERRNMQNGLISLGTDEFSTALTIRPPEGRQKQPGHHAKEHETINKKPETFRAVCGVEGN
jgi:hypothetical protein